MKSKLLASFSLPSFIVGCVIIIFSCGIFYSFGDQKPALLTAIDYRLMDMMFQYRGPASTSEQVVIVDIDEKSLSSLGQWPWPRNILAELTTALLT